jgi:hypothetical protein
MGNHAFVPYWVRWERTFFSYVAERAIPRNNWHTPPRRFFIFFQLLLNTSFHQITLGQSDSAPTGAPSIHWIPEHRFPSDHTGPEWFNTHRRTIHPLDAWTCCGWTWTSPVPSPPVLAHRHRQTDRLAELIYVIATTSCYLPTTCYYIVRITRSLNKLHKNQYLKTT